MMSVGAPPPPLPGSSPLPPPLPGSRQTPPPLPPLPGIGLGMDETTDTPPPVKLVSKSPPPPPSPDKPKANAVDIDWDDDDEATTVFDKSQDDPARALLHSSPPPAAGFPAPRPAAGAPVGSRMPPPPPVPSKPPPAPPTTMTSRSLAPPPSMSRGPLPPPPMTQQATSSMPTQMLSDPFGTPRSTGSRTLMMALLGVVLIGVFAVGYFLMKGKPGSLVVTVAGPGNKPVDGVEIYVDGVKAACAGSPCRVLELKQGTHLVRVAAAGYPPTADIAIKVPPGEETVQNVELAAPSSGTGIKVSAEGRGLKLIVDGKEIGPLPQEDRNMRPGVHKIRIEGGERYEPFEKEVTIEPEQMLTLEPKLKVKKGLATIKLGANAEGARVTLVEGDQRRPIPRFPIAVELEAEKSYSIVAEKKGYARFERRIDFEDGQAEKTFVIDLSSGASDAPAPAPGPVSGRSSPSPGPSPSPAPAAAPAAAAAKGANANLTFSSKPDSMVILDGRPLGKTPKSSSVPPGQHTVVFVHPEHGRKAKTVNVTAGQKATLTVKFP
jgi:hypothetical protein